MFSPTYLCICIYCMLQLAFLMVMERRRQSARYGHEKYFLWMLVIALLSFVADIISSIQNAPGWLFPFTAAGNYFEIMLNTLLLPFFYQYVCGQIFNLNPALKRRINTALWALTVFCIAVVASNVFTRLVFYYDSAKVYHRGSLFWLSMLIPFSMMIIIEAFLISQKKRIESSYYVWLAFFIISPIIGWILQLLIFGLPFTLLGITFAAQLVFTNIQNRNIDKDYLTGAFNRQTLDNYMQRKIDLVRNQKCFSAILMDIDNFKYINDHYGHYEGDAALINTVGLLRESIGHMDFIARYGGDEFCVILESDTEKEIEGVVRKIYSRLEDYNRESHKPYQLEFSLGRAVYHPSFGNRAESFFKVIDQKMYDEKNARHTAV